MINCVVNTVLCFRLYGNHQFGLRPVEWSIAESLLIQKFADFNQYMYAQNAMRVM